MNGRQRMCARLTPNTLVSRILRTSARTNIACLLDNRYRILGAAAQIACGINSITARPVILATMLKMSHGLGKG